MLRRSVLITDLDNTLFDWVGLWHSCFSAMLHELAIKSGVDEAVLKNEIRAIHQEHGTSEYAFLIDEIPSLQAKFPGQKLSSLFDSAVEAFRTERRKGLKLYPTVAETLLKIKGAGASIVGYTESMAFYSNYRVRRLGLDGVFDVIFSPTDHDLPKGIDLEKMRKYPASHYQFKKTLHSHTSKGELKPNKEILLSIVQAIQAQPKDCIYVGDSLFKDIAMARDAGISDAWAQYGVAQSTDAYTLLKEVTHWSDEDVEREKKISERHLSPSICLKNNFSELLDHVTFENRTADKDAWSLGKIDPEHRKAVIDVWKSIVDVQKHFNEISLKIRGVFITAIIALSAAIGFLGEKELVFELNPVRRLSAFTWRGCYRLILFYRSILVSSIARWICGSGFADRKKIPTRTA